MNANVKHIDQSSRIAALQSEVSDLKDMLSAMQQIIVTQNKQISEIHRALFKQSELNSKTSKDDKIKLLKASILTKSLQ